MKMYTVNSARIVILIFAWFQFSCRENESTSKNKYGSKLFEEINSDKESIRFDSSIKKHFSDISNFLGIENLKEGFDEEQIRYWFEYGYSDSGKVLILKKKDSNWESVMYTYFCVQENNFRLTAVNKSTVVSKNPKSGWAIAIKKIKSLGLYNLRSYMEIPNYFQGTGGDAIFIETANKSEHQIFAFPSYEEYIGSVVEVDKILRMLSYIHTEFGYNLVKEFSKKNFPLPEPPSP